MSWSNITKPAIGDPTKKQAFSDAVVDDLNDLNSRVNSLGSKSLVKNGSFEEDSDADSIPDNWTRTTYTGGSFAIETSGPSHGAKAIKFTRASGGGNGGGYIDSDYFEVSEKRPLFLRWQHYCSAAGLKDTVQVFWFTAAKAACGTASTTIYSSTTNPTAWAVQMASAMPPSTARYAKVRLTGGYTDTDVAGSSYWDDVSILDDCPNFTQTINYGTAGSFTFVAPPGCYAVKATVVGSGGGGASGSGGGGGGGGAAGVGFAVVPVTPLASYTLTVAAVAAAVGSGNGNSGNSSSFSTQLVCSGGGGGIATGAGGSVGAVSGVNSIPILAPETGYGRSGATGGNGGSGWTIGGAEIGRAHV